MDKLIFYHGTDARMVSMTKEERLEYLNKCDLVIDYLWTLYEPLMKSELVEIDYRGQRVSVLKQKIEDFRTLLNEKGNQYQYINLYEKLNMLCWRNGGAGLYQYGFLYLSLSKQAARDYASRSFAGGELGLMAYRMIEGAEIISFDSYHPNVVVSNAIEEIKSFAQEGKEQPIVVTINDIETEYLLNEDGSSVDWDHVYSLIDRDKHYNFRYIKDIELDLNIAEYLIKNKS